MDCVPLLALVGMAAASNAASNTASTAMDNDHVWAARARAEAMQSIAENSRMYFGDSLARAERSGDAPREVLHWPYDGLAPEPRAFDLAALPAPIATVEWRRTRGQLVESHAVGPDVALAAARLVRPADAAPFDDWSRGTGIPDALQADERTAGWANGMDRNAWCSAWADCYEVDAGRVHLVVVRVVGEEQAALVAVVGGSGEPKATRVGELPAENAESVGASGGAVIAVADFDANGTRDCFVSAVYTGCGLCLSTFDGYFVLADAGTGRARATPYTSRGLEFIDLDGNARAEILSMSFEGCERCTDGKPHNFFVTNLLGFQDLGIVDLRAVHRIRNGEFTGRFPAFEWYANEDSERFRPLLTTEDKRRMGAVPYPPYARRIAAAATE